MDPSSTTLVWLMASLLSSCALGKIELSANVTSFSDPRGVCSLTTPIEFICDGIDIPRITWKINNTAIRIILGDQSPDDHLLATRHHGIQVQLVSLTPTGNFGVNMTSRLVIESSALNYGDQISCGSNMVKEILNYTRKAPPPPVTFTSDITKETGNSVELTLRWNSSFTETHTVDEYCVIAHGGVCQSETSCLPPDMDYTCSGLEAGRVYGFVVYAKNCGNQSEMNSTSYFFAPQVPERPSMCVGVTVYNQSTNKLAAIRSSWRAPPDPTEISSGIHQDVLNYVITLEWDGVTNETVSLNRTDVCRAGRCEYDLSTSFFGSYYTLSVAAENIVGLGEYLTCTPREINTTNTIVNLKVTANTSILGYVTIECQPLAVTLNLTTYKVCYGRVSQDFSCHNLTCLPPVHPNLDGRATVTLTQIERRVEYCYRAIITFGEQSVEVQGSFMTVCDVLHLAIINSTLSRTEMSIDLRCPPDSVGSLSIPNGVVCYSGTTLGSTANYICDDGFEVTMNSQRTCQADGSWSEDIPSCLQTLDILTTTGKNTDVDFNAVTVVPVAISLFLFLLLFVAGGIVACLLYKLKHSKKQQRQAKSDKPTSPSESKFLNPRALPPLPFDSKEETAGIYEELDYFTVNENTAYQQAKSFL